MARDWRKLEEGARAVATSLISDEISRDMVRWRQHLHANPEFGFEETETAAFIVKRLKEFGFTDIATGVGKTGVVATLRAGTGNRAIGLRADMDALHISEAGTAAYRSTNPGVMHACGHDGHVAMLLGAARQLAETGDFDGTVQFIFQPAEEWGQGMQAMLDDGLTERFEMDEVYGLHNMPGIPVGQFATRPGALMAAEDNFEIAISGSGGHSSRPHQTSDALLAACAIVTGMQNIVSRHIDPAELAVVSATEITTDGTVNAIASTARITGDARSYSPGISQAIEEALREIVGGIAVAHGCHAEVEYARVFVPLINDSELTEFATTAAVSVAGAQNVDTATAPIGASEDFARLLNHIPGNFMYLGNGDTEVLHHASYDFNDDALPYGAAYFTEIVRERLKP